MTPDLPLRTADFDYDLPPELVAQEPLPERSASRMLVVLRADRRDSSADDRRAEQREGQALRRNSGSFRRPVMLPGDARAVQDSVLIDSHFSQITSLIAPGDLLVLNTTKVRHARLIGTRPSGAPAEVLLIHPGTDGSWVAMGKPGSALQPGKRIELGDGAAVETVEVLPDGHRLVRFVGATAGEAIARFGRLPLPPYITRDPTGVDEERYQTVYARTEGSVAAPTAGLHFTPQILDALSAKGVLISGPTWRSRPEISTPLAESASRI
ncbi:MAG TPA: S-adenosylmethionine:tRNA ribosyltransferase-isomerase [Gemmatimonadales bacterium]|nr:S-adenosylmethionine:tRNA ribosyltransferase-isomerase [Gemmatimonadales bacterium]